MRTPLSLASLCLLALAPACGSTPATRADAPAGDDDQATVLGTTLGLSRADVKARFPAALERAGALTAPVRWGLARAADGALAATATFAFDADALAQIDVGFSAPYASMDVCAGDWRTLRARIDAALGPSSSDNLAAYWSEGGRDVELACNPSDAEAHLSLVVTRHREP
ncbi:MAG: hypothetical protein U1F43_25895 [Myxococcota bacterium]